MVLVDKNQCVGCGICVSVCPEAITLEIENGFARIVKESMDCLQKVIGACPQNAIRKIKDRLFFAVGTDDRKTLKSNGHVGKSAYFQIFEYSEGNLFLKETRENPKYKEDETKVHGDPGKAKATASALAGVDVLVGTLMGPNIVRLKNQFVCAIVRKDEIDDVKDVIKNNICAIVDEKNKKGGRERKGIILK
ncbi:MAG: 4Fe-4S binding protein [Syntrophaceae bacterium]|nr:4Fe-4S binding protein [Syntrophaceae bacterium]